MSGATSPRAEPGGEPVEIEVKRAVHDSAPIRALLADPDPGRLAGFEADGPPTLDEIVDRYLDTAAGDGVLRAAGLRARLRISGRGVSLTVKGRAEVTPDGLTTRMELEAPATADLDPGRWPASPARQLLIDAVGNAPLDEIAALRQRRQVRPLRKGATVVELSLDELEALEAGGGVLETRVELEAELKTGPASDLVDLAAAIAAVDGLGPALGSKLEFALAARTGR